MKLFAIRIVASNRFGIFRSERISLFVFVSSELITFNCAGFSEKKAISEPEINAEKNNSVIITSKLKIISREKLPVKIFKAILISHKCGSLSGSSKAKELS